MPRWPLADGASMQTAIPWALCAILAAMHTDTDEQPRIVIDPKPPTAGQVVKLCLAIPAEFSSLQACENDGGLACFGPCNQPRNAHANDRTRSRAE